LKRTPQDSPLREALQKEIDTGRQSVQNLSKACDETYQAYRKLPEESDAFNSGGMIKQLW
jgi:hypothetical protein